MMKTNIESLIKLDERNDKLSVAIGTDPVTKKRYSKDSLSPSANLGYFLFKTPQIRPKYLPQIFS